MELYTKEQISSLIETAESLDSLKTTVESTPSMEFEQVSVYPTESIFITYPNELTLDVVQVVQYIQSIYPENPVIGLVDDIELLIENPEDSLEMLNKMKDKITSMTGAQAARDKIILT